MKLKTSWAGSATLGIQVELNLKSFQDGAKCGQKLSLAKNGPTRFILVFGQSYAIYLNGYLVGQILGRQMSPGQMLRR